MIKPDMIRRMADASNPEGANKELFDACFDAHFEDVLAFARRRTSSEVDAEDVAAETFAVAWRRASDLPQPVLPWLYGVAHNVIKNQRRSERRRFRLTKKLEAEPTDAAPDPIRAVGEISAISLAFTKLSEGHREVLQLVAWEGLDTDEAASVLGCSRATFSVRLHRARRAMEKELEAAGHVVDDGAERPARPRHG